MKDNIRDYLFDFLYDILGEIKQAPQLTEHYTTIIRGAVRFAAYVAPEHKEEIYDLWYKVKKQLQHTEEG